MSDSVFVRAIRNVRALQIKHREYERALAEFYTQMALAGPDSVVLLVGPTRVGKSSIGQITSRMLVDSSQDTTGHFRHVAYVEGTTAQEGRTSMKHLTLRSLEAIGHPIVADMEQAGSYVPRLNVTESHLRLYLEHGMISRQTRWYIVDEAHQLLRNLSELRASQILDSLKSLGNFTKVAIGLIGGYELLAAGMASAHLNGRMRVVHLPRYGNSEDDVHEFDKVLELLDRAMELEKGIRLSDYQDSLHEGSAGSIGLLCEWIFIALALAEAERATALEASHFARSRLIAQLKKITADIALGEALLGNVPFKPNLPDQGGKRGRRKPGKRNPVRDAGPSKPALEVET